MASLRLEHVNVTVRDPARTAQLMERLFGWHVRWQGDARDGGRSIHVGSDQYYLALYSGGRTARTAEGFAKGRPLNHIGVEVEDIEAIEARVVEAGLEPYAHDDYEPGRRFYFLDPDGIEYEIVSYR